MSSRSLRVIAVLVLLVIGLLPGTAAAEPHSQVPRSNSVLDQALSFFAQIGAKIGCELDPHGVCVPRPAGKTSQGGDIGCGIDPNGHCIQSPTAQEAPSNQGEIGCTIDPSGHCIR